MSSVTLYPAGAPVTTCVPGDFGLTHGSSFVSRGIQVAQGLRFRGKQRAYAHWNHAFLITSTDGQIVEAAGHGIRKSTVSAYTPKEVHLVHIDASDEDRAHMVRYATESLGRRYGYMTCASIATQLITGLHVGLADPRQLICSAFVAEALEMAGYDWPVDTTFITPADLAARFAVLP